MKKNQTTIAAEPGRQEYFITREFEAPRELVFKAYTDPALVAQWLKPCNLSMRIDKWETAPGGAYRYVHITKPGEEYGFRGVFHECASPERIIQTFEFEGLPEKGHVCLSTTRLEPLPGNRTRVIIQDVYQSVTDRDDALRSGMESGINEANELLDELLKDLQ